MESNKDIHTNRLNSLDVAKRAMLSTGKIRTYLKRLLGIKPPPKTPLTKAEKFMREAEETVKDPDKFLKKLKEWNGGEDIKIKKKKTFEEAVSDFEKKKKEWMDKDLFL